ncbi:unnamed protein product [Brassica oleracea var. botrytis]
MEAVSGGSRIYHTPTLGSVVNSIKWNHTSKNYDKNIYICGKKMMLFLSFSQFKKTRSRGLTESVMSSSRKCKSDDSTARDVNCNLFKTKMRAVSMIRVRLALDGVW